jgi:hypothetical protein
VSRDRIFSTRRSLSGNGSASMALGFNRRTMALLLAAILAGALAFLVSGGGIAHATATQTINVSPGSLTDHECNSNEWHFVITQIDAKADAPATIHVVWANNASEDVALSDFTGHTAHYTTTSNLGSTVVSASAVIYSGWSGTFVLSHGPCGESPSPTPSKTTETPTASPTPSVSETPSASPSPSESKSTTTSASPTPSVGASTATATVPTAVPAGLDGGSGGGSAWLVGLLLAGVGAVAGTAVLARRRFLHE